MPSFENIVETKIAQRYKWHLIEIQLILKEIENIRQNPDLAYHKKLPWQYHVL